MGKNYVLPELYREYVTRLNHICDLMREAIELQRKIERIEFLHGASRGFSLKGVK